MDNGCKTYQHATLEMVWLGTQSRSINVIHAVPDPDLEMGAGWRGGTPPKIFSPLRASVWFKYKGRRAPLAPPLDPALHV